MTLSKFLSFFFILCFMIPGLSALDFFFFSKFYNDGLCKPIEELDKYMLKSKRDNPQFNVLEPLLLMSTDDPIVNFGLYLTNNQKAQLEGAHAFFKAVYPQLSETEKVYFPDMVTCVTRIPYFSLFGFMDTYGIMYNLVPTLEQNREEDLSGDEYTLNDLVDIYLDVFKAMKVLIEHDYFLTEITHDEIGIVMDTEDLNTHIRGKIRHMHHLRTTAGNCKPQSMQSFKPMMESLTKFGSNASQVDMRTSNPCQLLNVHDLWNLFIESVTAYFNRQQGVFFNFNNCIQDMVERHNSPQMKGAQGYCPQEIQVAWKDINIRRGLRMVQNQGLIYTSDSVANFYLYVLGRMKDGFLENTVLKEIRAYRESVQDREEAIKQIQQDKNQLSELEKIEQQILSQKPKKKQKVSKEDDFSKIIKDREVSPSLVEEMSEVTQQSDRKAKRMDLDVFNGILDSNEDTEQLTEAIKRKKVQIQEHEDMVKDQLQGELDNRRSEIIFKFKRLVRNALIKAQQEKREKNQKVHEMAEIIRKKQQRRKIRTQTQQMSKEEPVLDKEVLVSEEHQQRMEQKIVIDSAPKKLEKSHESGKSGQSGESEISDYISQSSSNSSESLLMTEDQNSILKDLEREQMRINSIQISYDEEDHLNKDIIQSFEDEVRGKNQNPIDYAEASEDSVIMKDRAKALSNNEEILKHNLEGYILTGASLEMQNREIEKLELVESIYKLRDSIADLVDQNVELSDPKILGIKGQIQNAVQMLIDKFGEAESLIEFDQSLEHYTLGDLRDDMTNGEIDYLAKLDQLKPSLS